MNFTGRTWLRRWVILGVLLALAGCGGGGGGDASSPNGQFSLSTNSLTFVGRVNQALPASQTIVLSVSSGGAGYVEAGWPSGSPVPNWASVQIDPVNSTTVDVLVNVTSMPSVGKYSATLVVETTDSSNKVLNQQNVQLTYTVETGLGISAPNDQPTAYQGASPQNVELDISNPNGVPFKLASAAAAWLILPAGTQSATSGKIEAQVDPTGLAPTTYSTVVTATDANDPTDSASVKLTFTVIPLSVSLSANPAVLGGYDGTGPDTLSETLSVSPLSSNATWTATVSSGGSWLSIGSGGGTLTAAQNSANFTLSADTSALQAGTYSATVDIAVTLDGQVIHQSLPVTLNRSAEKLLVGSYGVALSKFPSSSLLTRAVGVYDTDGTTTVPWTATSDSGWLTVTSSGTTGSNAAAGNLVLTANPAGLAADQEYIATVTVSTTDGVISNQEKIRVGLWVGSTDPVTTSVTPPATANLPVIAMDPVEPYAFLNEGGTSVLVYNVYTGALVTTYNNVGLSLGAMAVSDDGTTLYAEDVGANTIVPVTVPGGTVGTPYSFPTIMLSHLVTLAYGKVSDEPMLISGPGIALDLTSGQLIPGLQAGAAWVAISPDGYAVTALDTGNFPSTLWDYRASYSSLSGTITLTETNRGSAGNSSGADLAATMDGSGNDLLLAADSGVSDIEEGPSTGVPWTSWGPWTLFPLPSVPVSVAAGWNGVIVAGNQTPSGVTTDISVYSSSGTLLESIDVGSGIAARSVRLSGDATRMSALSYSGSFQLYFISVP